MKELNKKLLALVIVTVSTLFLVPLAKVQSVSVPRVLAWTDRQKYLPGEKGTLFVTFYNDFGEAVEVKNITLIYNNWNAYVNGEWVGNDTHTYTDITLADKETHVFTDITFGVPTDGRAVDTSVSIQIGTDHGYQYTTTMISLQETSRYMEQIVFWFTLLVVLVIVCTIILAATIFLSARRPQVTWKTEEKQS